jgi:putative hydrolase of the HAD superfamily
MFSFYCAFAVPFRPIIYADLLVLRTKPAFIYFDLDDTLLDHRSAEKQAQEVVWHSFTELQAVTIERWVEMYATNNRYLWDQYGRGLITKEKLQRDRFAVPMKALGIDTTRSASIGDFYLQTYERFWSWTPGAKEALHKIVQHFPCGILTNGFERAQERKFHRFGLDDGRFILIISEKTGFTKPQPGIFDYAAKRADVNPENILYVGDNFISDILGASAAGWRTAWYNPTQETRHPNPADLTFAAFKELLTYLELS